MTLFLSQHRTYIMGISMICVMLFHQRFLDGNFFDFFHHCGRWGVDVFLVVSGFGIAFSISKNNRKTYFVHIINRLLPTCVFFGLINTFFSLVIFHAAVQRRLYFMLPFSLEHWYIFAIAIYYLLAPYICKTIYKYKITILCVTVIISYIMLYITRIEMSITNIDVSIIWPLDWAIERFPAFCFGMILFTMHNWKIERYFFVFSAFLICLLSYLMMSEIKLFGSLIYCDQIFMLLIPAFCLFCGILEKATDILRITNCVKWVGKYSLQMYLAHELCFALVKRYVPCSQNSQFLIAILISILYAYLVYLLVGKIKILRR